MGKPAPFIITDAEGEILARFSNEQDREDALHSGEFPDDAEPAFLNDGIWTEDE